MKELYYNWKSEWYWLKMGAGYQAKFEGRNYYVALAEELFYGIAHFVRMEVGGLYCNRYGHKIEDRSYAGPDQGDMNHECVRCGMYWSVPLY